MKSRIARLGLVSTLAFAASCVKQYAEIRVVEGATIAGLSFTVTARGKPAEPVGSMVGFQVETEPCTQGQDVARTTVWLITARDGVGAQPAPMGVVYGEAPADFDTPVPAHALKPGCYAVSLDGAGVRGFAGFEVRADGTIQQRGA